MSIIKFYKSFREYCKVQKRILKVLCTVISNQTKMKKIILLYLMVVSASSYSQLVVGDCLPSFELQNPNNQNVAVSATDDSYLLIDFWASWCAPCRAANKKMVAIRKKFPVDELLIIGVALDTDKNKWLKAIEKDTINYTQLIDPNGFDAKTALQFGVGQLPASYLFDKSGKLIAINPTYETIRNILNPK